MKWIATILALFLCAGCTITVKPLPTRRYVHRYTSNRTRAVTKLKTVTVDSEWMHNYKRIEAEKNYTISDDQKIKPQRGKFRVPQSVADHYGDLLKSPPSPTPP